MPSTTPSANPPGCRPLQTQVSNLSSVGSISLQASSSSTESAPPGLMSCGSLSLDVPSTPGPTALIVPSLGNQMGSNSCSSLLNLHPSTIEAENQRVLKIVAQYCVSSFELPSVVNVGFSLTSWFMLEFFRNHLSRNCWTRLSKPLNGCFLRIIIIQTTNRLPNSFRKNTMSPRFGLCFRFLLSIYYFPVH